MMPMADVFLPDTNFVPQRGVYPTSPGGSSASAAAPMSPNTSAYVGTDSSGTPTPTVITVGGTTGGKSLGWWVGFLVFLLVVVFVARKAGGEEDFRNIRPTFYNFMTITLTSIVGIVGLKVIAAKWKIPGASDVILAA